MRSLFFLLYSLILLATAAAQQLPHPVLKMSNGKIDIADIIRQQRMPPRMRIRPQPVTIAQPTILSQPTTGRPTIQPGTLNAISTQAPARTPATRNTPAAQPGCRDTSFLRMITMPSTVFYVETAEHAKDDGMFISGTIVNTAETHGYWHHRGILLKTDNKGNVLWSRLLTNNIPTVEIFDIGFKKIKELGNGDIIATGISDTADANNQENPISNIYRLDANGNIIWYDHLITHFVIPTRQAYLDFNEVTEAPNGDLFMSGTTMTTTGGNQGATLVRLDRTGNILWDVTYPNGYGAEGINTFIENGQLLFSTIFHSGGYTPKVANAFFRLDYNDGHEISRNIITTNYNLDPNSNFRKQFTSYYNGARKLANGHIIFYGQLFSGFSAVTDTVDYYGLMEFDQNLSVVNAYSLSSRYHTSNENTDVFFDETGNGLINIIDYMDLSHENTLLVSITQNKISKQRFRYYINEPTPGYPTSFAHFNDGGYLVTGSIYDATTSISSTHWDKLHDTDTSSQCLGVDTSLFFQLPLYTIDVSSTYFIQLPVTNMAEDVAYPEGPMAITATAADKPCKQQSLCDLIKIQGQSTYCGPNQPQIFSVKRNPLCGSLPLWDLDTAIAEKVTTINDSTISVTFKNINWQGKLYAHLSVGTCAVPQIDSLPIQITTSPQPVALGPDTILCTGNSITLHAGPAYSTYNWQDGSHDSTFQVTQTGTYTVNVSDFCGNNSAASIKVTPANFPFTLGPDLKKCNNDTLQLLATGGFINYQWSAATDLTHSTKDSIVYVYPQASRAYTVIAEKWPGCFVNATINVNVFHSPAIDLGNDTSFCAGGFKTMLAGPGFDTYVWSTGETTPSITGAIPGAYTVIGTTADGCRSYDTLRILANYPYPAFSLAAKPDTAICAGTPLQYKFASSLGLTNTYIWSDGYNTGDRNIATPGAYDLTITSPHGCATSHSIDVTVKPTPVVDLGKDTTLCTGINKLLEATTPNASYAWQDGSTASEYNVSRAGLYFVRVTLDGCAAGDSILVAYTGPPSFTLGKDSFLCQGMQFVLDPGLTDKTVSYLWQDGSTDSKFVVRSEGLYRLTATNNCGSKTASKNIEPGLCKLVMPSGFTPNRDGSNDIFRVKYPFAVRSFHMEVFNRWGGKVFESANIRDGWDGTLHGAIQPQGTYAWFIWLTTEDGQSESASGTVVLIR